MPTLNLGQVRPVYRGEWNSTNTYTAYDFVVHNGSAYLALKDVPANYEPPRQTKYWVLFGAKGDPGTPGEDGVDGVRGERGPSPGYRWDGTFLSIQNPDGSWPDQGIDLQGPPVPLSHSVTSTSTTDAASSKAVKTAYDRGSAGITAAKAAQTAAKAAQTAAEAAQTAAKAAQTDINTLRTEVPSIAAHAAGPSNKYIDFSGDEYTAQEDGYVSAIDHHNIEDSAYRTIQIQVFNPSNIPLLTVQSGTNIKGNYAGTTICINKGQKAVITSNMGSAFRRRFIYANGNAPE